MSYMYSGADDAVSALKLHLLNSEESPEKNINGWMILAVTVCSSAVGMLLLKHSQLHDSRYSLFFGYLLEGTAFALYPLTLRYLTLRVVVMSWSTVSALTALLGGALLFNEAISVVSMIGCVFCTIGVVLISWE